MDNILYLNDLTFSIENTLYMRHSSIMKIRLFFIGVSVGTLGLLLPAQDNALEYVERYKEIAIQEMQRSGVPASIKLAQGMHESNYGRSELASRANNHFGIKCGNAWDGRTYFKEDDDYDPATGELIKSCFRVFRSAEASYVAHSEFLRDPSKEWRYGPLFRLDITDYRSWARGLKDAGYATDPSYPEKLIRLIETYQLYQYDRTIVPPVLADVSSSDTPVQPGRETPVYSTGPVRYTNDVKYVLSGDREAVSAISQRTQVSLSQLIRYNEALTDGEQRLEQGTKVYLQPKRSTYRGRTIFHVVKSGESLLQISQEYGIKISALLKRNRLETGMEPAVGQSVKLRGSKVKKAPEIAENPAQQDDFMLPDTPRKENEKPATSPQPPANPQPAVPATVRPKPEPIIQSNNPATEIKPANGNSSNGQGAQGNPPAWHEVKIGDTLWNIAQRYGTTVENLRRLNNLTNDSIQLGQRIRLN